MSIFILFFTAIVSLPFLQFHGQCPTSDKANEVFVLDSFAYVASYGAGLDIINISDPQHPVLTGNIDLNSNSFCVYVEDGYAYVGTADIDQGLKIVDVSNPVNPILVGQYNCYNDVYSIQVQNGYAYGATSHPGYLIILNITNPASPTLVGQCGVGHSAIGMDVNGNYAYLAAGDLIIINISNPANPFVAGSFNGNGYASDVSISGNYAYMTQRQKNFMVVNISNPSNPFFMSQINNYCYYENYHNYYDNGYVTISDLYKGIYIADVTDPSYPVLCDSAELSGFTCDVYMTGDYIYVADGYGGLKIFSLSTFDTFPPVFFNTTVLHNTSSLGPFLVNTGVTDHSGVDSVLLFYKRSEDPGYTALSMGIVSESDYLDSIPLVTQSPDTVMYYIQAWDRTFFSLDPIQGSDSAYCFLVDTTFVGPVIESTTVWHDIHYSGPFTVFTKVYDSSGVANVFINYRRWGIDPTIVSAPMANQSGDWFYGFIPAINSYDTVHICYFISAVNQTGTTSYDPEGAPAQQFSFWAIGALGVEEGSVSLPIDFKIQQIIHGNICISLVLPLSTEVSLKIFDISGRLLDEPMSGVYRAGGYNVNYNPSHNGVYIVTCTAGGRSYTKKITILE